MHIPKTILFSMRRNVVCGRLCCIKGIAQNVFRCVWVSTENKDVLVCGRAKLGWEILLWNKWKLGLRAEFCSVLRFLTFWFLGDYNNDLDLRIINHQGLTIIIELFDWHLQWQQCLNKEICFFKHPTSVSPLRRAGWLFLTRWMKFQVESNHHPATPRCSIFPHRPHWPANNHRLHHL